MARVFVARALPGGALDRLADRHDVEVWPEPSPPPAAALAERAVDVEGLLTLLTDRVDGALIASAGRLRAIANYAVGTDNVDLDAATAAGIPVGNTPDVLTDATADLAFALLLAAARRLPAAEASVRAGDWSTFRPDAFLGHDVAGATLGGGGYGRIGGAGARRAGGFALGGVFSSRPGGVPPRGLLPRAGLVGPHPAPPARPRGPVGRP